MAEILNLDALTCEVVTVQKGGRRYELRDDIPTDVMVRVFGLAAHEAALKDAVGLEEGLARFEELRREVLKVFTGIVRHSLPDETAEGLADAFSYDEQMRVVQLFFARRSSASRQRAHDSSDGARLKVPGEPRDSMSQGSQGSQESQRQATAPRGESLSRGQRKRLRQRELPRELQRERAAGCEMDEGLIR